MTQAFPSILVTGGHGMVGSQVAFGVKPDRDELDILDQASIERALTRYQPRAILHLAALTDMAACEREPGKAYEVNVVGTYHIARACREAGIRLAYLSTTAVFDGAKNEPYVEDALPHPVSVYGRTKWIGESIVSNLVPDSIIIRTAWLFGSDVRSQGKFVHLCLKNLKEGRQVKATNDRRGSLTHVVDLVEAARTLLEGDERGIVHVVNAGLASYYDIALAIKRLGSFPGEVLPVPSANIESGAVRRGAMEGLASKKFALRPWQDSLREYLASL